MESVIPQLSNEVEYVVIDGSSTDGTQDIIAEYADHLAYWVSERDSGIYDAMNKGTLKSRGKYVYFLNSGDTFFSPTVLTQVTKYLKDDPAVLVGKVSVPNKSNHFPLNIDDKYKSNARIVFESHLCHQALFVRRQDLINVGLFASKYPRFADFHSTWKIITKKGAIYKPELIVSHFPLDGVSSDWRKAVELYKEKEMMLAELGFGYGSFKLMLGRVKAHIYKLKMHCKELRKK